MIEKYRKVFSIFDGKKTLKAIELNQTIFNYFYNVVLFNIIDYNFNI